MYAQFFHLPRIKHSKTCISNNISKSPFLGLEAIGGEGILPCDTQKEAEVVPGGFHGVFGGGVGFEFTEENLWGSPSVWLGT